MKTHMDVVPVSALIDRTEQLIEHPEAPPTAKLAVLTNGALPVTTAFVSAVTFSGLHHLELLTAPLHRTPPKPQLLKSSNYTGQYCILNVRWWAIARCLAP